MGILSRFSEIVEANVNDLLDRCEDPAKMVDQTLRNLKESLAEVKKETQAVMAEEARCKRIVDEYQTKISRLNETAKKAVQAGNDGDARTVLAEKQNLEQNLEAARKNLEAAASNASRMRQMHDKLLADINACDARRANVKATVAMANAQERVNQATSKFSSSNAVDAFNRMEEKAQKKLDMAIAGAELGAQPENPVDDIINKYTGATSSSIDDELAQLKAEFGA